jgi:hypothetical protein
MTNLAKFQIDGIFETPLFKPKTPRIGDALISNLTTVSARVLSPHSRYFTWQGKRKGPPPK